MLFEPFEIRLVLAVHESAEPVNFDFQESFLLLRRVKLFGIFQKTCLYQLALDDLHPADKVDVAGPSRLRLLNLLVFVDESNLLLEKLFVF